MGRADQMRNRRRGVLQIIGTLAPGGAEVRMLELIGALEKQNIEFTILQTSDKPGVLTADFERAGSRVLTQPMKSMKFVREFFKACVVSRVQVFQCGVSPGAMRIALWLPIAAFLGVPVRSVRFHSDGQGKELTRQELTRDRVFRFVIRIFATTITGVSPSALTYAWHANWQKDSRCSVLVAGVDLSRFAPRTVEGLSRTELGIPETGELVLHIGRSTAGKNRDLAIKTFGKLIGESQKITYLLFVGSESAEELQRLQELAKSCGVDKYVRFLGHRNDVASLMRAADCLLFTSKFEGLPGVVFEARAAGLPVLSSRLPGTEYLAGKLRKIILLNVGDSPLNWATALRSILDRYRPTDATRAVDLNMMIGTEFDLRVSSAAYLQSWGIDKI